MHSIVLSFCILGAVVPSLAQFNLPFDTDCTAGRLLDPFLVQALKSKYPKKYNSKLDFGKDWSLDSKLRGAGKLLARHMKNINALNYDVQNLLLQQQQQQQQQQAFMQPMACQDPSAFYSQQQQQQLASIQVPFDTARSILQSQVDSQLAALQQVVDQRYQAQNYQLPGAQSNRYIKRRFQSSCEENDCSTDDDDDDDDIEEIGKVKTRLSNPLSSLLSAFFGALKTILK